MKLLGQSVVELQHERQSSEAADPETGFLEDLAVEALMEELAVLQGAAG